jgi:hypothetical protein
MSSDDGWALWSNFLALVTKDVGSPDSLRMRSNHLTLSEEFASQATPRRRLALAARLLRTVVARLLGGRLESRTGARATHRPGLFRPNA